MLILHYSLSISQLLYYQKERSLGVKWIKAKLNLNNYGFGILIYS